MRKYISILVITILTSLNSFAQIEVDSTGNVGVGTITPTSKLDVIGVIKALGGNSNEWNSDADSTNELQQLSTSGDTIFISNGNYIIIPGLSYLNNTLCPTDGDADGVGVCLDCNDADSTIYPGAPELCDGKDNDCDGLIDEDFPTLGQACNTGLPGLCAAGTWQCQGGAVVCISTLFAVEICNGIDDDCDGIIPADELDNDSDGFSPCQGDCNDNVSSIRPTAIELCNGIDDNCDGQIDEGNPGGGGACNTGLPGVCASGILICQNGSLVCVSVNNPSAEVCDGIDNDCDGQVDNGNPGGGGTCNTGLLGVCAVGTLQCQGGALVCIPVNNPSTEICGDGLDNDCDGQVDEGCP